MPPVIYLDTCCLNRLTDELGQPRLLAEAEAMTSIFTLINTKKVQWIASTLLTLEISRNPNPFKREYATSLLPSSEELLVPTEATHDLAAELFQQGLSAQDALHVALAQQGGAQWFLPQTTGFSAAHRAAPSHRNASIL